ncbi:smoothelin-like protein 1 [Gigantopelta aegis]|uniref:smoothelin-like protein 1 n=1 Tax=Gigantopelta aegis TaxID=1735272 RepID=UPI001B88C4C3|nr:smoothelin-like protein 1 [Gigantopelta aegis]
MVYSKVEITLVSQDREEASLKSPVVVVPLKDSTFTSGECAVLECQIHGQPEPSVSWRKNGMIIGQTKDFVQSYVGTLARLEIRGSCVQDSGLYECVANNSLGETFTSGNLTVKDKECSSTSCKDPLSLNLSTNTGNLLLRRAGRNLTRTRSSPLTQTSPYLDRPTPSESTIATTVKPLTGRVLTRTYSIPATQTQPYSPDHTPSPTSLIHHPRRSRFSPAGIIGNLIQAKLENSAPPAATMVATDEPEGKGSTSASLPTSPMNVSTSTIVLASPSSSTSTSLPVTAADNRTVTGVSPESHFVCMQVRGDPPVSPLQTESSSKTISDSSSSPVGSACDKSNIQTESGNVYEGAPRKQQAAPRMTRIRRATTNVFPGIKEIPEPVTVKTEIRLENKAEVTQPVSMVSRLRMQFSAEDDRSSSKGGGGVRRWRSLPPKKQEEKPSVVIRNSYYLRQQQAQVDAGTTGEATMPSYDDCNDEEELMKLMNKTDDFDERKKIRARLRIIREQMRIEREEKRVQREKETEDLIKKRHQQAEEEKRKKLQRYKEEKPMCDRQDQFLAASQHAITDKHKVADEEKQKALDAYKDIAAHKETHTRPGTTTTTTTATHVEQTPGGGTRTTTIKKTETVSKTSGFGGMQYSKPGAENVAIHILDQLTNASGPGTSGSISVQTESWNSHNGIVQKSQKTESWGAKPAGPKGAMAAFKQMDGANNPSGPSKPKMGGGMVRSSSSIKESMLNWTKAMTKDYENIQITNFSSSWNNGLAFCALIHHFFPQAFDYNALSPKNRRYNFDLAFNTAEKEADIAPLLDTDDMVKMKNPDWKCVFTYVQSIYRHLRDHDANKAAAAE